MIYLLYLSQYIFENQITAIAESFHEFYYPVMKAAQVMSVVQKPGHMSWHSRPTAAPNIKGMQRCIIYSFVKN